MNFTKMLATGFGYGIRRVSTSDAPEILEAARESVEEIYPWMEWCHPWLTLAEIEGWAQGQEVLWIRGEAFHFAVVDAQSGRINGLAGLTQINRGHRFANLYYWIRTSSTRKGAATAATRLVATYGLRELGLQRIEIVMSTGNLASQRVAEKAGAVKEGLLRCRLYLHGKAHDAWMYSLTQENLTAA